MIKIFFKIIKIFFKVIAIILLIQIIAGFILGIILFY